MLSLADCPLTTRNARVCKAAYMTCAAVVTGRLATRAPADVHVTALMRAQAAGMAMDKATPVAPGESTVSVNLDVVFELGR